MLLNFCSLLWPQFTVYVYCCVPSRCCEYIFVWSFLPLSLSLLNPYFVCLHLIVCVGPHHCYCVYIRVHTRIHVHTQNNLSWCEYSSFSTQSVVEFSISFYCLIVCCFGPHHCYCVYIRIHTFTRLTLVNKTQSQDWNLKYISIELNTIKSNEKMRRIFRWVYVFSSFVKTIVKTIV